jgi:hypothetical protein
MARGTSALVAFAVLTLSATACGSESGRPPVSSATSPITASSEGERYDPAQEQLHAFIRAVRSKLGDGFVGTRGSRNDAGEVSRIDVILVDSEAVRARVDEVRTLFATVVPTIAPEVLRFVFAPFSATVDRAAGTLVVTLDGKNDESADDAEQVRDWATAVAPIPVQVKIARDAGRNELLTG